MPFMKSLNDNIVYDEKAIHCYDTNSDMIIDTHLEVGEVVKVLGLGRPNDGNEQLYRITDSTSLPTTLWIRLSNGLIAERMVPTAYVIKGQDNKYYNLVVNSSGNLILNRIGR